MAEKSYIEVSVTKTARREGVEYSYVEGPELIKTWVPSELVLTKDVKAPAETKDVKGPEKTK